MTGYLSPGRCAACGRPAAALVCVDCLPAVRGPGRLPPAACPVGHPYTPENTTTNGQGRRLCRACKNARQRAYYERTRDAANLGRADGR